MGYPKGIIFESGLKISFVKIDISVDYRLYAIMIFYCVKPFFYFFLHFYNGNPSANFHIKDGWHIAVFQIYNLHKIFRLLLYVSSRNKKVIGSFGNILFFCPDPISPELTIYNAGTFGGFYKCKAYFNSPILHIDYFFPIYNALVTAYINTVNFVAIWNFYLKSGIKHMRLYNKKIYCVINNEYYQAKPKKYFKK